MVTGPKVFAALAGLPVTDTLGSVPPLSAGKSASQWPPTGGRVKRLSDVAATTGVLVVPSMAVADRPGQGLRTWIDPVDPASTIATTTASPCSWISTFEPPWIYSVP